MPPESRALLHRDAGDSANGAAPRVKNGQVWASPLDRIEYVVVTTRPPWREQGDPSAARLHPVGLGRATRIGVTTRILRRDWHFIRDDAAERDRAQEVLADA